MSTTLLVGTAEMDITPPAGTKMAGNLYPRASQGTDDPLMAKAIVLEADGVQVAYVTFDLVALDRTLGEQMAALVSARTGIPIEAIAWSCSHTHSGPYPLPGVTPSTIEDPVPYAWRNALPERVADCVAMAKARQAPARVYRTRDYRYDLGHNRRLRYKDGRQLNTWLLHNGEAQVQAIGAAGPIDPEVGILGFVGLDGTMLAVLYQYALHANAHFGIRFSGDYPAVVAARLREHYGAQVCALFMPGACGDQNPVRTYREIGNSLADAIIAQLTTQATPLTEITLGACRRVIEVPTRDAFADQEARLQATQWGADPQQFFRDSQRDLQAHPGTTIETALHAWHVGEVAFASFPGELFVEHGLHVKADSPFPWTYPVELSQDALGYLITRSAWEAGGYESLVASMGRITPEGVEQMVETSLAMLRELHVAFAIP